MAELKLTQIRAQMREMSVEQLNNEIAAQHAEIYSLRRRNAMKTLDNTAGLHAARKKIARALTLLRDREIVAQREANN